MWKLLWLSGVESRHCVILMLGRWIDCDWNGIGFGQGWGQLMLLVGWMSWLLGMQAGRRHHRAAMVVKGGGRAVVGQCDGGWCRALELWV